MSGQQLQVQGLVAEAEFLCRQLDALARTPAISSGTSDAGQSGRSTKPGERLAEFRTKSPDKSPEGSRGSAVPGTDAGEATADAVPERSPVAAVAKRAGRVVESIRDACDELGATPADMPVRSRQAFQWLAYVSFRDAAEGMADDLRRLKRLARQLEGATLVLGFTRFYPGRSLFRARQRGERTELTVHIGFVGASDDIFHAVAEAAAGRKRGVAALRRHARSTAYLDRVRALEECLGEAVRAAQGRYYDLDVLFDEINHRYFRGELERPRLRWSRRRTTRKMGHYDTARDTVVLSRSLDAPEAPPLLVEFVMYHELLHKALGVPIVDGRMRAHTPAFRRAERRFSGYDEAQRLLDRYAGTLE